MCQNINEPTQQDTTSSRQLFDSNNDYDAEPSSKKESVKFESGKKDCVRTSSLGPGVSSEAGSPAVLFILIDYFLFDSN